MLIIHHLNWVRNSPAVKVFPVPGPPCSRIIRPFPFDAIMSSLLPRFVSCLFPCFEARTITRAFTKSFVLDGSTSLSNASLFQDTSPTFSTRRETIKFSYNHVRSIELRQLTPLLILYNECMNVRRHHV